MIDVIWYLARPAREENQLFKPNTYKTENKLFLQYRKKSRKGRVKILPNSPVFLHVGSHLLLVRLCDWLGTHLATEGEKLVD
jgi:hypothetical protein